MEHLDIDIDIDILGFIDNTMYGRIRVRLNPPPPQSSIARSGAGVGIAFRVRLPLRYCGDDECESDEDDPFTGSMNECQPSSTFDSQNSLSYSY